MRRRRAGRTPTFRNFDDLMEAAIDEVGPEPELVAGWIEKVVKGTNDAGWVHKILNSLLASDDYYGAKFIGQLKPQIARFLADEAAEAIYELGKGFGEEEQPVESYPGENPYGPYGRIE